MDQEKPAVTRAEYLDLLSPEGTQAVMRLIKACALFGGNAKIRGLPQAIASATKEVNKHFWDEPGVEFEQYT